MNRTKATRRKTLNIIYFIDSEKTKSIQISVSTVIGLASAFLLMVLWSFTSIYLGYVALRDRANLLSFVRDARNTLFEYEARFEGVYENVYPSDAKKENPPAPPAAAEPPQTPPQRIAATPEPKAVPEPKPAPPEVKAKAPVTAAAPIEPKTEEAKVASANESEGASEPTRSKVTVDSPVFRTGTDTLELRVNINNQDNRNKAEGYVWALATFKGDNGEEVFVAAPKGMQINAGGEAGDPRNAQRYAIQFHKPKNFVFNSPNASSGKFTQVKIVLQDYSGQRSEFKFPISDAK